ncbi:MAG: CBS domain-containing protein [Sphaerochaeta sp.]|jgi:acetoin utilization protein AcuB|uniref:CBS domain-containing protein n=1 Tax=unclassified Sphaerochaeta TaxID=2637943 RepID=UPI000ABEB6FC|nr:MULTISPECIES: CBS domain-containing protein [unclassified Sphaerochaeta]MCK9602293.1 CBS domain-containing protein [Sphaerochaeta sp.]MDX9824575.1 CBS domain-containing protein [Sphaerochaeta sp.]NLE15919.1 CBS domain-containing protein [Spirochaetales bacterium]HPE92688.1 CBS domain-containing protein [Sphaerochaeta sp.]
MIIERRMTRNPVTATPDMSIAEASALMKQEKVHRLPVLDKDKKLVGIITEKDILYASPSPASSLSIHEMAYLLSKLTVKKLMSKNVVTISKDTTVEEAARMMVDQDLSSLPVLEGDKLIGIVTKSDMFKILLELFGARHFGVRVSFIVEDKPGTIAKISQALSEQGIDIITFGTFMGTDPTNAICTIKVQGAPISKVVEIIKPFVSQLLDVREV